MLIKSIFLWAFAILVVSCSIHSQSVPKVDSNFQKSTKYTLVIHGGAGTIRKDKMSDSMETAYIQKLNEALKVGDSILKNGGTALNAIEKTINVLEDSPLFNAGKGSVFANDGSNRMDAAIMDGKSLKAGAVADVSLIKNPISLARLVKDSTNHVLLSGVSANDFAKKMNVQFEDESYFYSERRWRHFQKALKKDEIQIDHDADGPIEKKKGTVGAVALDQYGNLAAATSTGGLTNKKYGRIGDTPIIGAGTYANNKTCAISCTGHGEDFIRLVLAHDVSAMMEYGKLTISKAAEKAIQVKLTAIEGQGGLIGVDSHGNITMEFNTSGMYRGYVKENSTPIVEIYK